MRRGILAVGAALMLAALAVAALLALRDEPAVFTNTDAEEAVESAIERCRRWAPASDPPAGRKVVCERFGDEFNCRIGRDQVLVFDPPDPEDPEFSVVC